ncbi:uncharacterized protein LOC113648645 isoform X1 [Tachysurus ichikawai]
MVPGFTGYGAWTQRDSSTATTFRLLQDSEGRRNISVTCLSQPVLFRANVSEEELHVRLCSESVLLIRREDVLKRITADSPLPPIDHPNDPRWKTLNVEGQVRKMIEEENCEEDHPKMTHITIPAAYSSGITLFALKDSAISQELLSAPELPLL